MLLTFIAMLPESFVIMILILIGLIFVVGCFFIKPYSGDNPYIAILLSFLIPGAGISYIGLPVKGLTWYFIQFISVLLVFLISQFVEIEEKYLGLIIMMPFFVQLYVTGIEFKKKHGDINW